MTQSVRITLIGAFASALLVLSPHLTTPAHAVPPVKEIRLNSSNVQIVKNTAANSDVLNLSLNVTSEGDFLGSCDVADADDLLETGVHISLSKYSCAAYAFICGITSVCPVF